MPNTRPSSGDPAIRRAMEEIPRELFVSAELNALEHDPGHRIAREGRMLQPPEVVARLLEALQVRPDAAVLELGAGTGYTSAVMARLGARVHTVEWIPALADVARRTLAATAPGVKLSTEPPSTAWAEQGPFDAILVMPGAAAAPAGLRERLAVGGRLVQAVDAGRPKPALLRVTRRGTSEYDEEGLGDLRRMRRLGDLLVEAGAVDREQADQFARQAAEQHKPIGELLRDGARVPEPDIWRALAEQRGLEYGDVDTLAPLLDPEASGALPRTFLEHHRLLPLRREGERLRVATCDPDLAGPDLANVFHPCTAQLVLVTPTDYRRLWATVDLLRSGVSRIATPAAPKDEELSASGGTRLEARYVNLFESMLLDAIGERSSDIHLERYGPRVRVRIRVDGDLRDVPRYRLAPEDLTGIVNVVKIRADLDIAERRLPQGGRIRVKAGGKSFDLRVQTQPALHGEHVVIRILPQGVKLLTIEDLGFGPALAAEYRRLLDHPSGLVLVVGPTGSGKSTTLYAGLQILAQDATRKAITVEDPVEYMIEDIQQTQVRTEIGFAFADAMRSFVRQDPDVILVGEIRDGETALEAIRASQTGHLVLSTLHCNDTTDAVQRLIDLGMHPNSIASELLAVMSQRLAKRICEGCRTPAAVPPELLQAIFPRGAPPGFRAFRGSGCARCGGHGTLGRIACVEFLKTNAEFRMAISRRPPVDELRRLALQAGLVPLRDAALRLVEQGQIAIAELPLMVALERLGAGA